MNIQPNSALSSLAGTARAQARGTDSDRRSPTADVAADLKSAAVAGVEAGTKTDDRDADGRQQWEHPEPHGHSAAPDDLDRHGNGDDANEAAADPHSPAAGGSGIHIDFNA